MEAGAGLSGRGLYPRFSDAEFARRHRLIAGVWPLGAALTRKRSYHWGQFRHILLLAEYLSVG